MHSESILLMIKTELRQIQTHQTFPAMSHARKKRAVKSRSVRRRSRRANARIAAARFSSIQRRPKKKKVEPISKAQTATADCGAK